MKKVLAVVPVALALTSAPTASAIDIGQDESVASVEVHGFASQGFILSTQNNYLSANSTNGSFQYSEVGLNFTKALTDNLRMGCSSSHKISVQTGALLGSSGCVPSPRLPRTEMT